MPTPLPVLPNPLAWLRGQEPPETLDDLAEVLAEGPEPLPGAPTAAAAADAQALDAAAAAFSHSEAPLDDSPLPISSGSQLPDIASPEKREAQDAVQHGGASAAAAGPSLAAYLPSFSAWLPSRAASQQQEQPLQGQLQIDSQASWRDYVPSLGSLPLPSLHASSGGSSSDAAAPPDASASPSWAAEAQHQLSAACHTAADQLGTASSTAVGAAVLGAAVGAVLAGPVGAAAGAKSGAAWVAAGALGGAAVNKYTHHGPVAPAAPQEQELQPTAKALSPGSDAAAGGSDHHAR